MGTRSLATSLAAATLLAAPCALADAPLPPAGPPPVRAVPLVVESRGAPVGVAAVPSREALPHPDATFYRCETPCTLWLAPDRYRLLTLSPNNVRAVSGLTLGPRGARALVRPASSLTGPHVAQAFGGVAFGLGVVAGFAMLPLVNACSGDHVDCGLAAAAITTAAVGLVGGMALLIVGDRGVRAARGGVESVSVARGRAAPSALALALVPQRDGVLAGGALAF